MKSTKATRVFICYRREDTLDFAGRLHDKLADRYGAPNVVLDVDNVPVGVHFQKYLDSQIKECDLVLALIGRHWVEAADANGGRRLDNPRDYVRIEIESAMKRELPVVPVLVGGAPMPRKEDLPESIAELAEINAAEISSNRDFNVHVGILVNAIDSLVKSAAPERSIAPLPTVPSPAPISHETIAPGERLLTALKRKMEKLQPKTEWIWKEAGGWWSVRTRTNPRIVVRARPSKNLVRIRVRKNNERPLRQGVTLAYDGWLAETRDSFVRDESQLDRLFKQIKAEWG